VEPILEWAEPLPKDCPPKDSFAPQNEKFYRLVESIPPVERDFWSTRMLFPDKRFNTSECIARACSIISDMAGCYNILKLPAQRNKKIVEITLPPESGLIKKTGRRSYHFSWWRAKGFNPIPYCVEVSL